ncbi:hypothetical protein HHI36_016629 [Cryptolaemus montrouzieri]|uniref:Uncharacterized protein n=1 Tax=Cryptolaemus montrouzieri TaxID=559131 RepID=A0ABD2NKN4_9CUCU
MNYSIYKASKQTGVPWRTLKDFMARNENHLNNQQIVPKLGRLFALTIDPEGQLFNYIIKMLGIRINCPNAFISSFSHNNITNAFKKAGTCPLNRNVVAKEATAPSALTAAPLAAPEANEARIAGIGELSEIPQPPKVATTSRKNRDSRAKCLNEIQSEHQGSTSGVTSSRQMEIPKGDDDWVCGKCRKNYSEDAKEEKWNTVDAMLLL